MKSSKLRLLVMLLLVVAATAATISFLYGSSYCGISSKCGATCETFGHCDIAICRVTIDGGVYCLCDGQGAEYRCDGFVVPNI